MFMAAQNRLFHVNIIDYSVSGLIFKTLFLIFPVFLMMLRQIRLGFGEMICWPIFMKRVCPKTTIICFGFAFLHTGAVLIEIRIPGI